jgi:hypothetical protein
MSAFMKLNSRYRLEKAGQTVEDKLKRACMKEKGEGQRYLSADNQLETPPITGKDANRHTAKGREEVALCPVGVLPRCVTLANVVCLCMGLLRVKPSPPKHKHKRGSS